MSTKRTLFLQPEFLKATLALAVGLFVLVSADRPAEAQSAVPSYDTPDPSTPSGGTFPRNFVPLVRQLRPYQVNFTLLADLQDIQDALPPGWVALTNPADPPGQVRVSVDANVGRRVVGSDAVARSSAILAIFVTTRSPSGATERVLMGSWRDNAETAAAENASGGPGSIRVPDSFDWEVSQKNGTQRFRAHIKDRKCGLDLAFEATAPDEVGVLTTVDTNPPLIFRFADGRTANNRLYLALRYYRLPVDDGVPDVRTEAPHLGAGGLGLPGGTVETYGPISAEYRVLADTATRIIP